MAFTIRVAGQAAICDLYNFQYQCHKDDCMNNQPLNLFPDFQGQLCNDPTYSHCQYKKFNFSFISPAQLQDFDVNAINIRFDIVSGSGYFDTELSQLLDPSIVNNFYWIKTFTNEYVEFELPCFFQATQNVYEIITSDCQTNPFAELYVAVPPGQTVVIQPTVELQIASSIQAACTPGNMNCYYMETFNQGNSSTGNLCPATSELSLKLEPFDQSNPYTPNPRSSVPLKLELTNNSTEDITLHGYDVKVIAEDVYENLPLFDDPLLFVLPTPNGQDPTIKIHNYAENTHYFYLDDMQLPGNPPGTSQTISAGQSVILLVFTVPDPPLQNEVGQANFEVEFLRLEYEDGGGIQCCTLDISNTQFDGTVTFPGDVPCGSAKNAEISFALADPPHIGNCETAFDIHVKRPAGTSPKVIDEFYLEFTTTGTENLEIIDIIEATAEDLGYTFEHDNCNPSQCLAGSNNCTQCTGIIKYDGPTPTILTDFKFRIVLKGFDGTVLEDIDITEVYIRFENDPKCIPIVDEDNSDVVPLENICTHCFDRTLSIEPLPSGTFPNPCNGNGFVVQINSGDNSVPLEEIEVEVVLNNPQNLPIDIDEINCQPPNNCPPSNPMSGKNCIEYDPLTNTILYKYCPDVSAPQLNTSTIQLFKVTIPSPTGDLSGCIDVNFTSNLKIKEEDNDPCMPADATELGNNQYCIHQCSMTTVTGSIYREDGKAIEVPVVPANSDVTSPSVKSGVYIVNTSQEGSGNCIAPGEPDGTCDALTDASSTDCETLPSTYSVDMSCSPMYTVTPYKDIDHDNGVTSFDLVLMRKHILQLELLGSPYKIIASDANKDNVVSTFDLVQFQKLILQLTNELPNNTSWRFVDAEYVFPNPSNPFSEAFPECVDIDQTNGTPNDDIADFVAIKMGDVNYDAKCNLFTGNDTKSRSRDIRLDAIVHRAFYHAGEEIVIDFIINGIEEAIAWQTGLRFNTDYLKLTEAIPSPYLAGMGENCFGLQEAKEGKLRALWYPADAKPVPCKESRLIYTLKFKSVKYIEQLSDVLYLDDNVLVNIVYEPNGHAHYPYITIREDRPIEMQKTETEKYSIEAMPNPFNNVLVFFVQSMEKHNVKITLFDIHNREVAFIEKEVLAGNRQEIVFDTTENWGKGVFIWKAEIGDDIFTGKVIRQ